MSVQNKTMTTRFDVVIPLGKEDDRYAQSIESALEQDLLSCIFLVVNGRFPHNQIRALEKRFADAIKNSKLVVISAYYVYNANQARNIGISQGESPWVAFLDSDDSWPSNWLSSASDLIAQKPGVEFIFGSIDRQGSDESTKLHLAQDWRLFGTPENYIVSGGCTGSSALSAKRQVLNSVRWRPMVTRRQDCFLFMDVVRSGFITEAVQDPVVQGYRDNAPRSFDQSDIGAFLLEIRGRVPFSKFLSLSRSYIKSNLKNLLMVSPFVLGLFSLKHLDWYLGNSFRKSLKVPIKDSVRE